MITVATAIPYENGIFAHFVNPPWSAVDASLLDIGYVLQSSGDKPVSPFVHKLLAGGDVLSSEAMSKVCSMLMALYGVNWSKLWATMSLDYNPINNYDMTEEETVEGEHNDNDTTTAENTVNGSVNNIRQSTVKSSNNDNGQSDVYGFNSAASVPATKNTVTNTSTDVENATDTGETAQTSNTTTAVIRGGTTAQTRQLTRKGNIGVTTTQQMIASERDVWMWRYFDMIFADIDKVLTLPIY